MVGKPYPLQSVGRSGWGLRVRLTSTNTMANSIRAVSVSIKAIDNLDVTLGAQNTKPTNLVQAAGLLMSPDEKVHCFRCHATDAVDHKKLTLQTLIPGVQCERCHGPAANHLRSVKVGDAKGAAMTDLRKMTSEQTANFCGQCHRTWDEIAGSG